MGLFTPKNDCPWTADGKHVSGCGCEDTGTIIGRLRKASRTETKRNRTSQGTNDPKKPMQTCAATKSVWYSNHLHACNYRSGNHPVTHMCYCGHRWS